MLTEQFFLVGNENNRKLNMKKDQSNEKIPINLIRKSHNMD